MSALSFELDGVTVWASNTFEVMKLLNEGYESDYIGNDQVLAYIDNGYEFDFYSLALQDEILYSEIPEWIKDEKTDYARFKELYDDYNHDEMQKLIDNGLDVDEAKELQDDGIDFDDIPSFLHDKLERVSVNDIKEWMNWINDSYHKDAENIANAAYHLDIEPSNIDECYVGYDLEPSKYGEDFYNDCYGMKTIPSELHNHIDWESYGEGLMAGFEEYNDYYFNIN